MTAVTLGPSMTDLLGAKIKAWSGRGHPPLPYEKGGPDTSYNTPEIEGVVRTVSCGERVVLVVEQAVDSIWSKIGALQPVYVGVDGIELVELDKPPTGLSTAVVIDRVKDLIERVAKLEGPPTPYSAAAVAEIRILRAARDGLRQRMHDTVAKHAALVEACKRLRGMISDPTPGEFTRMACSVIDALNEMESVDEQLKRIAGFIGAKNPELDEAEVMRLAQAQQEETRRGWRQAEAAQQLGAGARWCIDCQCSTLSIECPLCGGASVPIADQRDVRPFENGLKGIPYTLAEARAVAELNKNSYGGEIVKFLLDKLEALANGVLTPSQIATGDGEAYEGFPRGIEDTFCEHAVKARGQYDTTARGLSAEVLRLRRLIREQAEVTS